MYNSILWICVCDEPAAQENHQQHDEDADRGRDNPLVVGSSCQGNTEF